MASATAKPEAAVREYRNIYEALAAFQAEVPIFKKDSKAQVKSDKGAYSYTYAGLDVLVEHVVPLLGKQGIAWVCVPTVDESGRFMLRYGLYHGASDTAIEGFYPLPSGTPQQVGSAVTYARRYGLLSLTGTFPADEDDDGKAASVGYTNQQRQPAQQQPREGWRPSEPAAPYPAQAPTPPPAASVTSEQIEAAKTIDELREIYRQASPAGGLDAVLPTGEAVRDAITARRMKLSENQPPVTAAEAQQAISELGEEVPEGE